MFMNYGPDLDRSQDSHRLVLFEGNMKGITGDLIFYETSYNVARFVSNCSEILGLIDKLAHSKIKLL